MENCIVIFLEGLSQFILIRIYFILPKIRFLIKKTNFSACAITFAHIRIVAYADERDTITLSMSEPSMNDALRTTDLLSSWFWMSNRTGYIIIVLTTIRTSVLRVT